MEKSIAQLEREFSEAEDAYRVARDRRDRLKKELQAAKVLKAQENPHPWLGKKVKRQQRRGYRNTTVTRTGTVAIYDPTNVHHRNLRELYFSGSDGAGEPIVISASGHTGWRLNLTGLHPAETAWELVE